MRHQGLFYTCWGRKAAPDLRMFFRIHGQTKGHCIMYHYCIYWVKEAPVVGSTRFPCSICWGRGDSHTRSEVLRITFWIRIPFLISSPIFPSGTRGVASDPSSARRFSKQKMTPIDSFRKAFRNTNKDRTHSTGSGKVRMRHGLTSGAGLWKPG